MNAEAFVDEFCHDYYLKFVARNHPKVFEIKRYFEGLWADSWMLGFKNPFDCKSEVTRLFWRFHLVTVTYWGEDWGEHIVKRTIIFV